MKLIEFINKLSSDIPNGTVALMYSRRYFDFLQDILYCYVYDVSFS